MKLPKFFTPLFATLGLTFTILPSVLFLFGILQIESVKQTMTIGMLMWIVAVISWNLSANTQQEQ